jgi:hypothetical protein
VTRLLRASLQNQQILYVCYHPPIHTMPILSTSNRALFCPARGFDIVLAVRYTLCRIDVVKLIPYTFYEFHETKEQM